MLFARIAVIDLMVVVIIVVFAFPLAAHKWVGLGILLGMGVFCCRWDASAMIGALERGGHCSRQARSERDVHIELIVGHERRRASESRIEAGSERKCVMMKAG